ncbi:MGMT family protein [Mobilicoccus massiliensis]|uniref:MGMT family protein n=1 Tax=Mobilicoccus massiliensis TaxID=1522310 RepID=UPI000BB3AFB8|nr:MGMT family protein [Mobilicoccus massiliensis]
MSAPDDPAVVTRAVVASIPAGQVMAYGEVGEVVGVGPRAAGRLVANLDDDVPWWRVVYADGTPATCHDGTAPDLLQAEGVPFRGDRVDMTRARRT